jgi:hypothetical protein
LGGLLESLLEGLRWRKVLLVERLEVWWWKAGLESLELGIQQTSIWVY